MPGTPPKSPKSSVSGIFKDNYSKLNELDFANPLYLHPSDTSNASIINMKLKGTENYSIWANAMELALTVKNKIGFIDGTEIKDFDNDVLGKQWDRCNSVVLSWILNSISEELYSGQVFSKIAKDVWDELKETYSKIDGSVIYNLYKQINSTVQDGSPISDYYHKLNSLWRQYDILTKLPKCTCNSSAAITEFDNRLKLMQFLMGLDDSYQPLRTSLLSKDPLPSVKGAFAIISAEESHRNSNSHNTNPKTQASAFSSRFNNPSQNNQKSNKSQPFKCTHCNLSGHTVDRCFEIVGYPPGYKKKSNLQRSQNKSNSAMVKQNPTEPSSSANASTQPFTADQIAKLMTLISGNTSNQSVANMSGIFNSPNLDEKLKKTFCSNNVNCASDKSNMWIVDSGANQHMIIDETNLINQIDVTDLNLTVGHPNGTKAQIKKIGDLKFTKNIILKDVMIIPDYCVNLISVN